MNGRTCTEDQKRGCGQAQFNGEPPPFVPVTTKEMADTEEQVGCPSDDRDEGGVSCIPNERRPRGAHVWTIRLELG